MRQWFGVSANAALNTRWTQFINHVNYKTIDSNVMDLGIRHTNTHSSICQTLFFPLTSTRCTKKFSRAGKECVFVPRDSALFGADQKERGPWAQNAGRDLENAQSHCWYRTAWWKFDNYSFFMGTKCKCLRCELPTCNKYSVFEENEDVEE